MTKQDLAELGISEEDVLNRLVEKLAEQMVETEECYAGDFGKRLTKAIEKRVDDALNQALEKHVLPKVTEMVEGIALQETNKWGEKIKKPMTFTEYLVARADAYIREEVNYEGKAKWETSDSYSFTVKGTRITHMIHTHLQHFIQLAMTNALGNVNSSVRKGLEEAVKIAINSVKVTVETKASHS